MSCDHPEDEQAAPSLAIAIDLPDKVLHDLAARIAELLADRDAAALPSPWLTPPAAAAYLGCSRDRLYKLTAAKAIPFRRKQGGQAILFRRDELDAWVEAAYEPDGCAL